VAVAETQSSDTAAQRASGSSFYAAMRIMPRPQREAMYEIYSFCRKVDDIADSPGPRDERLDQLRLWRADINALYSGSLVSRARGLAVPIKNFGLKR
jgi:presqualene diphosphate synthase